MSDSTSQDLIEAAKSYEALFVPALFAQWAVRTADLARLEPGQHVLDVACGTGVLAREAASRVKTAGRVIGLDANAGMIAVAKEQAPDLEWRQGSAESLPFSDDSFDAVLSQFGLMFFSDRVGALREMLRVVKPGGRIVVAVWDSVDSMPAYATEIDLFERMAGSRAAEALRAPFTLGEKQRLAALFADAGIADAQVMTESGRADFPSIRALVEADLRGWLPVMGVVLGENQIRAMLAEAEIALGPHVTGDERAAFALSAHLVSARRE